MASLSPSCSPALSCLVCLMFSYSSASFSDNGKCNKCSSFAVPEARLCELPNSQAWLRTMEKQSVANVVSHPPVAGAGQPSVAPTPLVVPKQPGSQGGGWVTV